MNQVGFKNAASGVVQVVKDNWILILSAGVLYLEIRHLREAIESLTKSIDNLSAAGLSKKSSRSLSIASSKDDWYSIKSEVSSIEDDVQTVIEHANYREVDEVFFNEVDEHHYGSDEGIELAWNMIKDKDHSRSIQMLIRKTRAQCSLYGQHRKHGRLGDNQEKRREYATQGLAWAEDLISRAPTASYGHRYKAASMGCMMEFFSVTEKAQNGKIIKECLAEALRCDPDDQKAHYILARWHYEASNLPWAIRGVAAQGMPPASEAEALHHFDISLGGSGHDKEVQLYRYKLLIKANRTEEAKKAVEGGIDVPLCFNSDKIVHDELVNLKYSF